MKTIALQILAITLVIGNAHAGDIYRHVDEDGTVKYSDQPSKGSSKVEIDPINIDASPKLKPAASLSAEAQSADSQVQGYSLLAITAPEDGTTLRNTSEIQLTASVKPGLRNSHRVRFLDNGEAISSASRTMSLLVTGLERGSHQITAEVIDENDQVIISSAAVSVHVHKTSILQPRPATAPPRVTPAS